MRSEVAIIVIIVRSEVAIIALIVRSEVAIIALIVRSEVAIIALIVRSLKFLPKMFTVYHSIFIIDIEHVVGTTVIL